MAKERIDRDDEDLVRLYLTDIGQYVLLNKDDEVRLDKAIEEGKTAEATLKKTEKQITPTRRRELNKIVRAGARAERQFVQSNLRLVVSIAKKYQASGLPLLVAGRPELRGETWSIICESVLPWEEAQALTPEGIAAHLAKNTGGTRRFAPRNSTPSGALPRGLVPDEREGEIVTPLPAPPASEAAADPVEAPAGAVLHIRFSPGQSVEESVRAMEVVKAELRSRPGSTKVVIYIPQAGGAQQLPLEIRSGVAWDPSFPAAIRGRVGATAVRFNLLSEGESLPAV